MIRVAVFVVVGLVAGFAIKCVGRRKVDDDYTEARRELLRERLVCGVDGPCGHPLSRPTRAEMIEAFARERREFEEQQAVSPDADDWWKEIRSHDSY